MGRQVRGLKKATQKVKKSEVSKGDKSGGRTAPDGHIEAKITPAGPVLRVRLNNKWYVLSLEEEEAHTRTKLIAKRPPPAIY